MNYKIDFNKLNENLAKMTGNDFMHCEMQERKAGNMMGDVSFTKSFQARLSARALKEDYGIIQSLPIFEYNQLCQSVNNFLQLGPDALKNLEAAISEETSDNSTEK